MVGHMDTCKVANMDYLGDGVIWGRREERHLRVKK